MLKNRMARSTKEDNLSKISEIFKSELPGIPTEAIMEFANNMIEYHRNWKRSRKVGLHYNKDPNYISYLHFIYEGKGDQFWVYSPNFIRVLIKTLNWMFNTEIREISHVQPQKDFRPIILAASFLASSSKPSVRNGYLFNQLPLEGSTLWSIVIERISTDSEKVIVSLRFPLDNMDDVFSPTTQEVVWNTV